MLRLKLWSITDRGRTVGRKRVETVEYFVTVSRKEGLSPRGKSQDRRRRRIFMRRQQLLPSKFDVEAGRDFVREFCNAPTTAGAIYTVSRRNIHRAVSFSFECSGPKIERGGSERRALARLALCTSNFADVEHASKLDRWFSRTQTTSASRAEWGFQFGDLRLTPLRHWSSWKLI